MKILSAEQVRQWDQFTIAQEPISSLQLMERAAGQCVQWLLEKYPEPVPFRIFCGKGNNGGDGLAIARLLADQSYPVSVHILEFGFKGTTDFQANLARLHQYPQVDLHFIQSEEGLHGFASSDIIIDAIYGTGLNRPLEGLSATMVHHINASGRPVIAIDIPTGLMADHSSKDHIVVKATHTLSFQCYKKAFLFAENGGVVGQLHILDIGLHPDYLSQVQVWEEWVDDAMIQQLYRPRLPFAHKGHYGHVLISAGSYGKMGAAVLCARAALRGGAGLVTAHIPACGYTIMQTAVPEAMVIADTAEHSVSQVADGHSFDAWGLGPGWGSRVETAQVMLGYLEKCDKPVVLDADALNTLSEHPDWFRKIPAGSLLTPHPREFERLFGPSDNDFARAELARERSKAHGLIIILKGHHTLISLPSGMQYYNSTGNAGMATAGSGDVLTGLLTALLAQGYTPTETAVFGVYLHGLAGDLAADALSPESMVAGDIIQFLPNAFLRVNTLAVSG